MIRPAGLVMAGTVRFLVGLGLVSLGFFLLDGGISYGDATQTGWVLTGGLLFALGAANLYTVTAKWWQWRKQAKADGPGRF